MPHTVAPVFLACQRRSRRCAPAAESLLLRALFYSWISQSLNQFHENNSDAILLRYLLEWMHANRHFRRQKENRTTRKRGRDIRSRIKTVEDKQISADWMKDPKRVWLAISNLNNYISHVDAESVKKEATQK